MKPAVIRLYRDLLKYGRQLKYTDREYYFLRIRDEFQKNKHLDSPDQISKAFKVNLTLV